MRTAVSALSWALAITFACGAIFHVSAMLFPALAGSSSASRHAVFVLVNAAFATGFALRWRHLLWPALALAVQQARSHGTDFVAAREIGEWDVKSLGVLVMLPIMLGVAWAIRRDGRRLQPSGSRRS